MHTMFRRMLVLGGFVLGVSQLFGETVFVTFRINKIFQFDTSNVNIPATSHVASAPDNITYSPDGLTVYFTSGTNVFSFPASNPAAITNLNTGIPVPIGIAISTDGTLGFTAQDSGVGIPGLYSFPTGGVIHPGTLLTATGTVIPQPLFIAINGPYAFVGDYQDGSVYSVDFTSTTYNATLIQTFGPTFVGGIAISSDGFLYISKGYANQIVRVPLSNPTAVPTVVANLTTGSDGLTVSSDGKTVYFTFNFSSPNGVYSFPTNLGFPATVTPLTNLVIDKALDITIFTPPLPPLPPVVTPPTNLTGRQEKNDFALVFERVNILNWSPSAFTGVVGYNVYRNGSKIAALNAATFSYEDHDIRKGVTTLYSVTAFDNAGNESAPINVTIN